MAKLFLQTLPSKEELKTAAIRLDQDADPGALYTNLLFMKVATELENHLDGLLAPYNLSTGRFTLLCMLSDSPEGLMPSEMSARVGVTQATISGLINGLEKSELIQREMHQKDGRSFVIRITEQGRNVIKEIFPVWGPKVAAFWNQFSSDERNGINKVLEKMVSTTSILT